MLCVKSFESSGVRFMAAQPVIAMSGEEAVPSYTSFYMLESILNHAPKGRPSINRETFSPTLCPVIANQTLP